MLIIFQSIAPIFLILLLGNLLARMPGYGDGFWAGLERLSFYVLYPVLLFVVILQADFAGLALGKIIVALGLCLVILGGVTLASWQIFKRYGVSGPTFSSMFQTSVRWNGFIALAIAEKMFPPEGAAMVALVMAVIIIPINVSTVVTVAWFTHSSANIPAVAKKVATNPLILGAALGLACRFIPGGLPDFFMDGLHLMSRSALGMGLLTIGAGLQVNALMTLNLTVLFPTFLKLVFFPILVITVSMIFGISGMEISYLALCAAVPTAMNGYVLAKQMGGDAQNYATTATLQTIIAFFSIPVFLYIAGQFVGG